MTGTSYGYVIEVKQFEIFSLILLDKNADDQASGDIEQQLRSIINQLKKFRDVESCREHIEQSSEKNRIILIVSGQLGKQIVPDIDHLRQVTSIYVYCMDKKTNEKWASRHKKVKAVIVNADELITRVREDHNIQRKVDEPLPIVFSGKSMETINGQFVFTQILIDCLLRLKSSETDLAELISCCQEEYRENPRELENLREFQNDYKSDKALHWYTKETFLYKNLNAALRKQNIHMIFLFRTFISDIYRQLKKCQTSQALKVYRGQRMTREELTTLKSKVGQFIAINSFFSTSSNYAKTVPFLHLSSASDGLERVLFEIQADPKVVTTKPFANITEHSSFDESEVLFMISSIFRLDSIDRTEGKIWLVRMTLSSDGENTLKPLLMRMKEEFEGEEINLRTIGTVLQRMGQLELAEKYFLRFIGELKEDDPLLILLYDDMGKLASLRKNLDESIRWHQKALRLRPSEQTNDKSGSDKPSSSSNSKKTSHGATASSAKKTSAAESSLKPMDDAAELLRYVNKVTEQAMDKPPPSETIPPRLVGTVENFTLLYIDRQQNKQLALLRPTLNFIRTLNDPHTLTTLLPSCENEKLIVIIPLDQAQPLLSELQQHKCFHSIYLLSSQTDSPAWATGQEKVVGIYQNFNAIRDYLAQILSQLLSSVIPFEIASKDDTTDISFTYCQLLKETMLCEDEESDLKKDMLAFCRTHYADNAETLREIDYFETSFVDDDIVQWYTRSCFVTKILSRAFRTQEIDLLFKMRHFIQCLYKQICSLASKQPITCYAVLDLDQDTVQKFRERIDGLALFHSFVCATMERPKTETHQGVVFSLQLEPEYAANIEKFRSSNYPFDVLINLDAVFRVLSVDANDHGIHTIHLQSVSHDDAHFQQLTSTLREETKANVVIVQMTQLALRTDHYLENDHLLESVYQDLSFANDATLLASLAGSHHQMGFVNITMRDFEGARRHFFKSLRAFLLCLPHNHVLLSSTYNYIGTMFYQDDQHEHAIQFYRMAIQCQLKASSPDMDDVATYVSNIGTVHIDMKKYSEALKHLKRAASIRETMPMNENTKPLISLFQKIAKCLRKTGKGEEALEYYKKTLELQLNLSNPADKFLSLTYYNLSVAYEHIDDYDNAVDCAEKSVECLKRISESHPQLEENQAQLESVRKKQCVKQTLED